MWGFLSLVLLCVTLVTLFGIYAVFRPLWPSLSRGRAGDGELADLQRQMAARYEELRVVREMLADMALERITRNHSQRRTTRKCGAETLDFARPSPER